MRLIKLNSKKDFSRSKAFNFKLISDLNDFEISTLLAKGKSPELEADHDKLFMVMDGKVLFNVDDEEHELENGDSILVQAGETFSFNSTSGARLVKFNRIIKPHEDGVINNIASTRQSTRVFSDESVSRNDLYYILKVGMEAPSGANLQPWKFVVVSDPEMKRKVREGAERIEKAYYRNIKYKNVTNKFKKMGVNWKKPFLESVPFLICVFGDTTKLYYKESLWLSIGWMLLAANEMGLGTLTYKPKDMIFLNEILGVEDKYMAELIIPVGYSAGKPTKPHRKDLHDVVSWV